MNKLENAGIVKVKTIDAEANAGQDYQAINQNITFASGEKFKYIDVVIYDDEEWEPDEDFFVTLCEIKFGTELEGEDVRCRVTIIDDDKPGNIHFKEKRAITALASEEYAEIVLERKGGSDGVVTVDYITLELDETEHTATADVHFEF